MANEKLPEDLVMEVLCRLQVKSLLRFKSVCKNWYSLIQNPSFISLHHNRATSIAAARNTDCLLAVKRSRGEGKIILSLVPNETPTEDIDVPFTGSDIHRVQLLGCNGVVCLTRRLHNSTIVICNPSIREFRVLPKPSYETNHFGNLGFGFDPYTNDYKVVKFGYPNQYCPSHIYEFYEKIEIYKLSTDSWRTVDTVSPVKFGFCCWTSSCTSWNGDIYWHASCSNGGETIIVFRMSDEVLHEIPLPKLCFLEKSRKRKLLVVNDSLALVLYPPRVEFLLEKCFDIWVLDAQGVGMSWTKKFTIGPFHEPKTAVGFRQNGEFLLQKVCGWMMSYHIETRQIKEYQVFCHPPTQCLQVLPHIESLVSVKRHNQRDGPNDLESS